MRILLVHNFYQQAGGEDVEFRSEATLLKEHGHEVVEYTEDNRDVSGVPAVRAGARAVWSRASRAAVGRILAERPYDVAHVHNTFLRISPAVYYACADAGVPVVQTLQNYRLLCPVATFYRAGRVCEDCLGRAVPWPGVVHACYRGSRLETAGMATVLAVHRGLGTWRRRVAVYVALTEFGRRKLVEGGLPADRIVVKPNCIHPDPGPRQGDEGYALYVGRLTEEKGLRTLLRAWRDLDRIPLRIVGTGPLEPEVRETAAALRGRVEVLGWRERTEAQALLRGARALVVPSEWYEGFPVVIAEAFAHGVPVVAARIGPLAEIVEDGVTGLLFTPGDADDLASTVPRLFDSPAVAADMGRRARAAFEANYTAERNYEMLMGIYRAALGRREGRA